MTNAVKILGQSAPAATTLTVLYTTPSNTQTTASSIVICNQDGTDTTFRVSVAPLGAADSTQQYLYYDQALESNSTFIATIGITLASASAVRVYSGNGSCSFNLFGVEVS